MRDCIDFRPRIQDSGGSFTGSGGSVTEIPMIGTNINADFTYFLGRIDKIAMNFDGKFIRIPGVPDINPRPLSTLVKQ